jgi:hypothetical protein
VQLGLQPDKGRRGSDKKARYKHAGPRKKSTRYKNVDQKNPTKKR